MKCCCCYSLLLKESERLSINDAVEQLYLKLQMKIAISRYLCRLRTTHNIFSGFFFVFNFISNKIKTFYYFVRFLLWCVLYRLSFYFENKKSKIHFFVVFYIFFDYFFFISLHFRFSFEWKRSFKLKQKKNWIETLESYSVNNLFFCISSIFCFVDQSKW